MGYVDEVLCGYEVIEQLPGIAKQWADIERKRPQEAMAQPKLSLRLRRAALDHRLPSLVPELLRVRFQFAPVPSHPSNGVVPPGSHFQFDIPLDVWVFRVPLLVEGAHTSLARDCATKLEHLGFIQPLVALNARPGQCCVFCNHPSIFHQPDHIRQAYDPIAEVQFRDDYGQTKC